jgi:2-polyprenyl-3-methyl-5-hydroxy-6-metoxy-1,4-benzoquinol methylase
MSNNYNYDLESKLGGNQFSRLFGKDKVDVILSMLPDLSVNVLDVGCWDGYITQKIAEEGHLVTAIDISQKKIDQARNQTPSELNIRYLVADAGKISNLGKFDCIILGDVIEHIPKHPVYVLNDLKSNLKSNSKAVISVPYGIFNHSPGHLWKKDLTWWENSFEKAGYETINSKPSYFCVGNIKTTWKLTQVYTIKKIN